MKYFKRIATLLVLAVLVAVGAANGHVTAQAQQKTESDGIGVSPTKLTLTADPGQTLNGKFTILNPGTEPVDYKVYVKDFRIRNEDYEKDFMPAEGTESPVSWFTVTNETMRLGTNGRRELDYQIKVPANAVPRGYYAVIFAETIDPAANTTGVARVKRVGTLVYLTVKGGSIERGKVESFTYKRYQPSRPLTTTLRIHNEGNVHFEITGDVRLKDILGRTVAKTELGGAILPGTIRRLTPELKLNQPFGVYKLEGEAAFLGKTHVLPGGWILVGSPFWIVLFLLILVGWLVMVIRWIKRRGGKRKKA